MRRAYIWIYGILLAVLIVLCVGLYVTGHPVPWVFALLIGAVVLHLVWNLAHRNR